MCSSTTNTIATTYFRTISTICIAANLGQLNKNLMSMFWQFAWLTVGNCSAHTLSQIVGRSVIKNVEPLLPKFLLLLHLQLLLATHQEMT